jgi:hypothetical protein
MSKAFRKQIAAALAEHMADPDSTMNDATCTELWAAWHGEDAEFADLEEVEEWVQAMA